MRNVEVEKVLEIADKYLKPCENQELEITFPQESDKVYKEEIYANLPVGTPLFQLGFKAKATEGKERIKNEIISSILLSLIAGSTSPLFKRLNQEGLINNNFSADTFEGDDILINLWRRIKRP